jgi:hypothetical protein
LPHRENVATLAERKSETDAAKSKQIILGLERILNPNPEFYALLP